MIWLCPLIPELLYFVLFYLVSIASGKVFSIHEKLISGVVHAHNSGVFPQHLKDVGHFAAYCTSYLGFFSSSKNQHGTSVASCFPDNKCILTKDRLCSVCILNKECKQLGTEKS